MNEHKEFTLQVKRVAGIKVAGCECKKYWYAKCPTCKWEGTADKASGGGPLGDTGDFCDINCPQCGDLENELEDIPCPTCAPLRELEKLCWHEMSAKTVMEDGVWSCSCGASNEHYNIDHFWDGHANPTYTIQSIKVVLESLGEWERCVVWIIKNKVKPCFYGPEWMGIANILTSDPLMLKAAIEFLKGVE